MAGMQSEDEADLEDGEHQLRSCARPSAQRLQGAHGEQADDAGELNRHLGHSARGLLRIG